MKIIDRNTDGTFKKGITPWNYGVKLSSRTRNHLSEMMKQRWTDPEYRQRMSDVHRGQVAWNKGVPTSEETKRKIGDANRGRTQSDEERAKRALSLSKRTPEQKMATRLLKSEKVRGDKCHLWRGGITPINKAIRSSLAMKIWREQVFERDNYTCLECGDRSRKGHPVILHADHIKPFAYYPALRFDITNGRTLCEECHRKTPTFAGRGRDYSVGVAS